MARRSTRSSTPVRRLVVLFGDQLGLSCRALRESDPQQDAVLLMEVAGESTHVPSHVQRTILFLSAMRHAAIELVERGYAVRYVTLDDPANTHTFDGEIDRAVREMAPKEIVCTLPGEWRVLDMVERWRDRLGLPVTVLDDEHFLTSPEAFAAWAAQRTSLTMEPSSAACTRRP